MNLQTVIASVSVMAIIMMIGVLIERKTKPGIQAKQLIIQILIIVAVPSVILNAIFQTDINEDVLSQMGLIFLVSLVINGLGILLGLCVAKIMGFTSLKARQIAVLSGLGNTGFIGIPLCASIFGPLGGLLASIFDAGMALTAFTLAVLLLQEKVRFSLANFKPLLNPPVFAITFGLLFAISGLEVPSIVKQVTGTLAGIAAPLAMLYVGLLIPSIFHKEKVGSSLQVKNVALPIFLKLLLMPIVTLLIMRGIPMDTLMKELIIIQSAMPTLTLATVLFVRYSDGDRSGLITVVLSTALSLLSIPVIAFFIQLLL
ncbi:AEC family transporter [Alkalihalobacillus sp. MEB130]|uniref:AEC family transporter n=1 Tax=Alkalihalobacillus sp. MEB130 TaxID=2976704 RepID=UPI0028DFBF00|nr:AEC family transporter [Alkalihalobacillus sp. MEB130]MDT8860116.1 AEC family transporter [Alkalihalobacillus sp. MEB130]